MRLHNLFEDHVKEQHTDIPFTEMQQTRTTLLALLADKEQCDKCQVYIKKSEMSDHRELDGVCLLLIEEQRKLSHGDSLTVVSDLNIATGDGKVDETITDYVGTTGNKGQLGPMPPANFNKKEPVEQCSASTSTSTSTTGLASASLTPAPKPGLLDVSDDD